MDDARVRRFAAPLREQVVDLLREAIVAGEFAPGERLVENRLCARFEVSRTVIREALRQLESEGLVAMVPNRGPRVAVLSAEQARSLFEVRGALEGLAGALFAEHATDEQCAGLESALDLVREALAGDDARERLRAKDAYYAALLAGTRNSVVPVMLRTVQARVQQLRGFSLGAPGRAGESVAELARITEAAARERDPEAARAACEQHVRAAAQVALAEMARRRAT
ncbi:GntR family transcriptional regulator [Streptomyces sp. CT34]|uniref:GntR family transcriptional regulator n=1 Tax=Streptomyces sp. CT34 TaxID=1553907 RepID=UPI0005B882CF|nr:GntR family transcriptional regulator [Streptomyces sp. CT34]